MSATEILVVIGGLVLGYWIMAVFVPSLWDTDAAAGGEPDPAGDREGPHADPLPDSAGGEVRWFEVMEIPESSSRQEITAAYKRLIHQYHPDRAAHMGRELRELAEIKSRQINVAYDTALKLRGAQWHA